MLSRAASNRQSKVIVVDDEARILRFWRVMLNPEEFEVRLCESAEQALVAIREDEPDVVVTDVLMNGMSGLDLLGHIKADYARVEVIVMTSKARVDDAVSAIKCGAFDYITKPFKDLEGCTNRVRQAARLRALRRENEQLRQAAGSDTDFFESDSDPMRRVLRDARRVAQTDVSVLLNGETGTGKSRLVRAMHDASHRRKHELVEIVVPNLTANLVESELFGHVKGAFTGATNDREGAFERADGGTIFLDEIGEMSANVQTKLLRVLQDQVVRRVGETQDRRVDVRVICATHVDIEQRVEDGLFREDLYFRIKVVKLKMLPLRERVEDLPRLAYRFLEEALARNSMSDVKGIEPQVLERFQTFGWPGNLRQLRNVIERAVVFETSENLTVGSLPEELRGERAHSVLPSNMAKLVDISRPWREVTKAAEAQIKATYLRGVLSAHGGNITKAAAHAGVDRANFRRFLRRFLPERSRPE